MTHNPNDSGFDLKDARLDRDTKEDKKQTHSLVAAPPPDIDDDDTPTTAPVASTVLDGRREMPDDNAPEGDDAEPDPRALAIAAEDRVARRKLILEIQRYYNSSRFKAYLLKCELVETVGDLTIPECNSCCTTSDSQSKTKTQGK